MTPRRTLLLAAFVLAAAGALGPLQDRPAAGPGAGAPGDSVVLPFLLRNNHILVRGVVGTSDSLWFIVDTGAMASVIDRGVADRLGLDVRGGAEAHGAGGRAAAGLVEGASLRLPGVDLAGEMLAAIDLSGVALRTGHPCDGIVGAAFFRHHVVRIDYGRGLLTLHDPARWNPGGAGAVLPLTFEQNHPYVDARVTLPGGEPIPGRFVLDTGSVMALILSPAFSTEHPAATSVPRTVRVRLGGVGGESDSPQGRLARLELGPFAVAGPLAVFRGPGPGQTSAGKTAGNIGGDVLRRFVVTFDYAHERMFLAPGPALAEPFEADMSGAVFSARTDSTHALEAIIVQDDSPALEQGVRVGDVLESVDGRAVTFRDLVDVRRDLRVPDRTVRLGLRRDGGPLEVTLTTRRLI